MDSTEEIYRLVTRWLPDVSIQDKNAVEDILSSSIGTPLLKKYVEMLIPYIDVLDISRVDRLVSGLVFFYGSLLYIMHFPEWGKYIEDIFLYNILYMLVDNYIDDNCIDEQTKTCVIEQMFVLITDPLIYKTIMLKHRILETIAITYHKLITRRPNSKDAIITLFKTEIEGLQIQNTDKLERDVYYNIALRKGGYTMLVLQTIVGNTDQHIKEISYHIGSIMQLIDDIIDADQDISEGISTIATYDLSLKRSLDELWLDIARRINYLDKRFIVFIVFYYIFMMYIPNRYPMNYSSGLQSFTTTLNLFNKDYDASAVLASSILNELRMK